jgi:hypothetical protein
MLYLKTDWITYLQYHLVAVSVSLLQAGLVQLQHTDYFSIKYFFVPLATILLLVAVLIYQDTIYFLFAYSSFDLQIIFKF